MRLRKNGGENKRSALRRSGIGRPRKLAYRQVLKIPFPASDGARKAAQQTLGIRRSQELDCGGNALAARFVQARLEQVENWHSYGSEEPGHRLQHVSSARFGQQQGQAVQQAFGVALQQSWKNGIQRAVGQRSVHQQKPAVLRNEARRKGRHVVVFFVSRRAFETGQNVLEPRVITSRDRDAPESFHQSSE